MGVAMSDVTREPDWPSQAMIELGCHAYRRENGSPTGSHGRGIGAAIMVALREHDAAIRQRIEALERYSGGMIDHSYLRRTDVLEALGGSDE